MTCKKCDDTITAQDDAELFGEAKAHFHKKHRFLPVTDDKIREAIAA